MNTEFEFETLPFAVQTSREEEEYRRKAGYRPRGTVRIRPTKRPTPPSHPGYPAKRKRPGLPIGRRRHADYYPVIDLPPVIDSTSGGSEKIRWLQDCLNGQLNLNLAVTGMIDPQTRSAIRQFQQQQKLRATGILSPATEQALSKACEGMAAELELAGEMQELTMSGFSATLQWQFQLEGGKKRYLLTRREAAMVPGGGVYIAVIKKSGKPVLLKTGMTDNFSDRFKAVGDYGEQATAHFRSRSYSVPASSPFYFYVARIRNYVPLSRKIEHILARVLQRAGHALPLEQRDTIRVQTTGSRGINVTNILPPDLTSNLQTAYSAGLPAFKPFARRAGGLPSGKDNILKLTTPEYPHWELEDSPTFEFDSEYPFSEAEAMELAIELLATSSEEELDHFLGKLFKGAWKGLKKVGRFVGKVAKPLGGVLKGIAKKALPFVGGALGSFIPIPGVGTALGSALGGALSKALELEFAHLEQAEKELEIAKRFVQLAGATARQAAINAGNGDPQIAVRNAVAALSRNLTHGAGMPIPNAAHPGSGHWQRQGRQITVFSV